MSNKKAIIIGAGPAGLTAAYELLHKTDITPIIIEMSGDIGGISKTVNYKGNRIDIGGHRFFSKSDIVMDWWQNILPIEAAKNGENSEIAISYQNKKRLVKREKIGDQIKNEDQVMLIRNRLSRIFYLRKFFDYPISINLQTIKNLGFVRLIVVGFSYIMARLFPIKKEKSLEDFFINRFGKKLYETFFKDYTEKVWGVSCTEITPDWGAQRIKGLSISKAVLHFITSKWIKKDESVGQKSTETSLIEKFMYPKFGPGQLWEEVARIIEEKGGQIIFHQKVDQIIPNGKNISEIFATDQLTGQVHQYTGDYFFSTMPVKNLIHGMGQQVPKKVQAVAKGLKYRDFITVGLLLNGMSITNKTKHPTKNNIIPDNWIYVQERDVKVGRIQVFNNWSPYMVKDEKNTWIGLEYFCNENDDLWNKSEAEMKDFAIAEMIKMEMIEAENVLDAVVIKMPKTYPAYFGTYDQFDLIKAHVNALENLFLVGRNGMHKYNNQDHSMLTAIVSVENIINGVVEKENIWAVNTEQEYHEEKAGAVVEEPILADKRILNNPVAS